MSLLVRRSSLRVAVLAALLGLCSCERKPAPSDSASPPLPTASVKVPAGSPLSRLVPKPQTGPRAGLPMSIVPGVSFGPIALGETLEDLKRGGLAVSGISETQADVTVGALILRVSLCAGKIIDIWMDDLRKAPASLTYDGKAIAPAVPRDELERTFGGCKEMPARIGGAFESCHDGGLYVGHGMGTFLQIRVRPKAFPFDDACAIATDDGSAVELSPKDRSSIFRKTLNLTELSKYWHVDKPGRDPLRIVKTRLIAQESLTMFGSPVKWIDEGEATKGSAYFTLTKLEATKTKATVAFTYPIEGLVGTAVFGRSSLSDEWRLETANVSEK
jgi:hypothetical protein